ncbi:MAG: hypothetical protein AAB415_01560 [Patescibacteria group bacterium]
MLKINEQRGATGVIIAIVIIAVAIVIFFSARSAAQPGELDGFAQCLKDKGVTFYGAFWCQHCQNQKKMFGRSQRLLPYVECSTANGQGMLPVCREAGITGYPTWVFPDETRESGEVPLETLAERSGCPLPADSTSGTANPVNYSASSTASSTRP